MDILMDNIVNQATKKYTNAKKERSMNISSVESKLNGGKSSLIENTLLMDSQMNIN